MQRRRGACYEYDNIKGNPVKYPKISMTIPGYTGLGSVTIPCHLVGAILSFRQRNPGATIADQVLLATSGQMQASHLCRMAIQEKTLVGTVTRIKETVCLCQQHLIWESVAENDARKGCGGGVGCPHNPHCIMVV